MPFEVPDLLGPYLLPLLIAVPLAIVVFIISVRRGDDQIPPAGHNTVQPPLPEGNAPVNRVAAAPQAAVPAPTAPAAPAVAQAAAGPVPLLVVDDSAVARAKLSRLFEGVGYQVTVAKDGLEALQCLAERRFAVLITDLEMPNKDGFELIADVQGSLATEDLPIIAITGHDEMQARVHQVQGLYGIFKKPWNDRELLKRVETLASLRPR
ncbi:response regulator [Paucibacter sp. DJ1R-11]|uniref:response regulator n=1 Tax=Paucibacter sp. DJ1R-11 TaxID=2893556 RepID=UPI0021E35DEE|nr:response regulator [Paucibacter sp. DJ1R-11]MCV2362718.1 response regulator [Paucibacter sp. DJ1R-11]